MSFGELFKLADFTNLTDPDQQISQRPHDSTQLIFMLPLIYIRNGSYKVAAAVSGEAESVDAE